MTSNTGNTKTAWVQLYEARRSSEEVEIRLPGRPPASIPRKKIGFTLSQGEIHDLEQWQDRLSNLLQRKISKGETVGIVTRIASARLARLSNEIQIASLVDLVERMVEES
jgi:hypothetical protein